MRHRLILWFFSMFFLFIHSAGQENGYKDSKKGWMSCWNSLNSRHKTIDYKHIFCMPANIDPHPARNVITHYFRQRNCFSKKGQQLFKVECSYVIKMSNYLNQESLHFQPKHIYCLFIWYRFRVLLHTSVSNRTGQCNFSGQRDKNSFLVLGQRDSGTSSKSCQGTGRDFDSLSRPTGQKWKKKRWKNGIFF